MNNESLEMLSMTIKTVASIDAIYVAAEIANSFPPPATVNTQGEAYL